MSMVDNTGLTDTDSAQRPRIGDEWRKRQQEEQRLLRNVIVAHILFFIVTVMWLGVVRIQPPFIWLEWRSPYAARAWSDALPLLATLIVSWGTLLFMVRPQAVTPRRRDWLAVIETVACVLLVVTGLISLLLGYSLVIITLFLEGAYRLIGW